MDLDRELRQAMQRVDPPADFAARLIERAETPARRAALWRQWQWAAACLVMCVALGWPVHREWKQHQEGESAKERLLQALQVTAASLQTVRQKVQNIHQ